jgi:hypothetical protein
MALVRSAAAYPHPAGTKIVELDELREQAAPSKYIFHLHLHQ